MSPAKDLTSAEWTKSSYSSSSGGDCLEFSRTLAPTKIVPVRDSKNPDGPVLTFQAPGWTTFITALKASRRPAF